MTDKIRVAIIGGQWGITADLQALRSLPQYEVVAICTRHRETAEPLAREHGIPFYVAAPTSTIDLATPNGDGIPIEERNAKEVTHIGGTQIAPDGAQVRNPSFDVTPHKYVTAIITEQGVFKPPFIESLANAGTWDRDLVR